MPSPLIRIAKVLSILLLACLPASACAAQDAPAKDGTWVLLGSSAESRVYLDSSRVEIAGGQHLVWLWADFTEPTTTPVDTTPFWGVRTRHRLNCAARIVEDLELNTVLDREGARLDTVPFEGTRRKPFADHMLGGNLLPLACQWLSRHRPARG
jgi:hypothetical protein